MLFFFFNHTATTEIYTLSLHDALPIFTAATGPGIVEGSTAVYRLPGDNMPMSLPTLERPGLEARDRKSTRLNSSHANISYAVFCLKKKKKQMNERSHILRCGIRKHVRL